jgi:hypothetical protein
MTKYLAFTFNYPGALGSVASGVDATNKFANTISKIIGFLTVMAGLWFMVQLLLGAFGWISAGGDKQHLDNAKKRITNAIVGLFLVVVSFAVFAIVGAFFGLDVLHLGTTIGTLAPP